MARMHRTGSACEFAHRREANPSMAEEDKKDPVRRPEHGVARLLIERLHLEPPIDVEGLARKYAQVDRDELPEDADAVVISRPGTKPTIVLDSRKPQVRQRFTLAHELGHILIPWHLGTVACHTDWTVQVNDSAHAASEAEANRFASELLMPRSWLVERVRDSGEIRSAFSAVKKGARVSAHAVSVGLVQVLGPGYMFAVLDDKDNVLVTGVSSGTLAHRPQRGKPMCRDDYDRLSTRKAKIEGVYWWFFDPSALPERPKDPRSATLILHDLLQSLGIRGAGAEKLSLSINGIIGAANSAIQARSTDELFFGLCQRFLSRPDLRRVSSHSDFDAFLAQRAREILGRKDLRG